MADKRSKQSLDSAGDERLQEDVVDDGGEAGAGQSLDCMVDSLHICDNLTTSSGSTAVSNASDQSSVVRGFSHDDALNSARAQEPWEEKIKELLQEGPQHLRSVASSGSVANGRDTHDYDHFQCSSDSSEKPCTAGLREEEEWETVLDVLPTPPKTFSPTVSKELNPNEKKATKQRGRGSFTYGGMGLYSELEMDADEDGPGSIGRLSDHCRFPLRYLVLSAAIDGEPSHVLVLNCSSRIRTKDLEEIVEPFSKEGSCAVRWVDNTTALAVFSSPTMAQEALFGINDVRVKVSTLSDAKATQTSVNDMAQPVPRPASSAQVAQRMIAGALKGQGAGKLLLFQNQGRSQEIQKQERERKLRLEMRAQMRDEAWGSDDD